MTKFDYHIKYLMFNDAHQQVFDFGVARFNADNHVDALLQLWDLHRTNKYFSYIQIIALFSLKTKGYIQSNYITRFNVAQKNKAL